MAVPRILVMVDLSNLYYCCKQKFSARIDYRKYLSICGQQGEIVRAMAYGAKMGAQADQFIYYLKCQGFNTIFKEPKVYATEDHNREYRKADWDVGMAVDAIAMMDDYDILILGSADSDMVPMLNYLHNHGKTVNVLACNISGDLKFASSSWEEIDFGMLETTSMVVS